MPFRDARAGWIVAAVAIALGSLGGLVTLAGRAASDENRLAVVELRQSQAESKMDRALDSLARIEQKVSDLVDDQGPEAPKHGPKPPRSR